MPQVDMIKVRHGYWCFHRALNPPKGIPVPAHMNPKTWLTLYCGCPLPLLLGESVTWEMPEEAASRLEALQGPYGDIIAKAFIAKYGKRGCGK